MQSSPTPETESAAHGRRVAAFSETLAARVHCAPDDVLELCSDLDEAVEFAALEGETVAEAIACFIEERWAGRGCQELAHICGYGSAAIDMTTMSLPVMPKQASRLLRTSNENTSAVELASIAASDPVLAGKLLGAANSALFGSQHEIVRLLDAVMRLGIPEARKVLLAACFAGLFASRPLQDLWLHSQAVARSASDLAPLCSVDPDLSYLAGLLHDIGRLAFVKLPQKLRIQEHEWLTSGFPVVYAETLAYGLDHAALAGQLLRAWELPDGIVEAVRFHHRPEHSESRLTAVLTLAEDLVARRANMTLEDLWPTLRRNGACLKAGISLDQLDNLDLRHSSVNRACG